MNCRPGDLAVVVRSRAGNDGRIVTCVRLATESELELVLFRPGLGPVWVIEERLRYSIGGYVNLAPDAWLKPLRDPGPDAVDETLEWREVPKGDELSRELVKERA